MKRGLTMHRVSITKTAANSGQTEETIRGWWHKIPQLAQLGERQGRDVQLELREVATLCVVAELQAQNRVVQESAASALAFGNVLDAVFTGQIPGNETVYLIESTSPDGVTRRR